MDEELKKIWHDQKLFNKKFLPDFSVLSPEEILIQKTKYTKEYILHLLDELTEILDGLNWKLHKQTPKQLIQSNLSVEFVDVFKYWMSIVILWGLNPDDIFREYWIKSHALEQQIKQEEWLEKTVLPLAVLDIDGILADYETSIKKFAHLRVNSLDEMSAFDRVRAKHLYRDMGMTDLDPLEGSQFFTHTLTEKGYGVLLLTARPSYEYKRLLGDTVEWLNKHQYSFNAVYFATDKQRFLFDLLQKNKTIAFFVDDLEDNIKNVANLKIRCYYLTKQFTPFSHPYVSIVHSLSEIPI